MVAVRKGNSTEHEEYAEALIGGGITENNIPDTVNQSKMVGILSRNIKDGRVISLIHKLKSIDRFG